MNKTRILLLLLLSLYFRQLLACDICACAGGGAYGSILPQFQTHLAGVRYQYNRFTHPAAVPNMNGESRVLEDRYHQTEWWMRYRAGARLMINAFLPYRINMRHESIYNSSVSGFGDLRLEAGWLFRNTGDSLKTVKKHTFIGTAGVKLNNGKYMQRLENGVMAPNGLQTGTGAMAGWLRFQHIYRVRRTGLIWDIQAGLSGTNELGYRPGRQFSARVGGFYWIKRGLHQWLIHSGTSVEDFSPDREYGLTKHQTGGRFMNLNAGAEWYFKRVSVQLGWQTSLFKSTPAAQPVSAGNYSAGLAYFF